MSKNTDDKERVVIYLRPSLVEKLEKMNEVAGRKGKVTGKKLGLSVFIGDVLMEYANKNRYLLENKKYSDEDEF